jgi:dihydroorotase
MLDIVIRNGFLMDSTNKLKQNIDIGIEHERILEIGNFGNKEAICIIDASDCIILPGLIDHHVHLYPLTPKGIPAEAVCFASGVTSVVDAGSTGCDTYENYIDFIRNSKLTIKAYLNISSLGLSKLPILEDLNPQNYNKDKIKRLFEKYPQELLGLKIRTSQNIVNDLKYEPLEETVKLAEKLDIPVMVHCTNPPGTIEEMIDFLRAGDIMTHMYQNIGHTILDKKKHVSKKIIKAQEKGIVFEASDARAHFSFEVSEHAIKEGFEPDIIATDLTHFSMYQRPTVFNLAMQLSKYEHLGIPFEEVIRKCTEIPSKKIGLYGEIGCLKEGALADIAIFKKIMIKNKFGDRPYYDKEYQIYEGNFIYKLMLTIKRGEIVFRDMLF